MVNIIAFIYRRCVCLLNADRKIEEASGGRIPRIIFVLRYSNKSYERFRLVVLDGKFVAQREVDNGERRGLRWNERKKKRETTCRVGAKVLMRSCRSESIQLCGGGD